ncbi:MAG: hypothetical protein WDW38_001717 [Sanguina aurantia]
MATHAAAYTCSDTPHQSQNFLRHTRKTVSVTPLTQLLRIEEEGAFVGLVNGSPAATAASYKAASAASATAATATATAAAAAAATAAAAALAVDYDDQGDQDSQLWADAADPTDRKRTVTPAPVLSLQTQRTVKNLVASVTRLKRRLDYIISELTQKSPNGLEPGMREVLRIAIYELVEKGMAPHALGEHVEIAKAVVRESAGGFANGVLRNAARMIEAGTLPDPQRDMASGTARDLVRKLAVVHSHPTWMVTRWMARFGPEAAADLMAYNNQLPIYGVRANLSKGVNASKLCEQLRAESVVCEPSQALSNEFVRVKAGMQALLGKGFVANGSCHIQDESAGLVVALLDPQPGDTVLDCCAAPGGKTMFAAARMRGKGFITAMDVSARRLNALRSSADAAGVGRMVTTVAADLRQYARDMPSDAPGFDKVLLDAPCSGTGVLAKRSDLRWRRRAEDIPMLSALQDELLDSAAVLVRPNGILMYSTCSIEQDEGPERIAAFLQRWEGQYVLENPHDAAESSPAGAGSAGSSPRQAAGHVDGGSEEREGDAEMEEASSKPVVAASWLMSAVTDAPRTERLRTASANGSSAAPGGASGSSGGSSSKAAEPSGSSSSSGNTSSSSSSSGAAARGTSRLVEIARGQVAGLEAAARGAKKATHSAGGVPLALITPEGFLTTLPHVHGMDGAFAARMRRIA